MPFSYSGSVNTWRNRSFMDVVVVELDDTTGIGTGLWLRVLLLFEVLLFVVRATVAAVTGFDDWDNDTAAEALRGVRAVRDDDAERPVDTTTGGMDVAVAVAPLRFRDTGAAFAVVSMVADSIFGRRLEFGGCAIWVSCPSFTFQISFSQHSDIWFSELFGYINNGISSKDFQVRSLWTLSRQQHQTHPL